MPKIKALPHDVVQLIAAGEVIDSLGAVVRELAENAIDAGATRIGIEINPKLWKIRVTDNGHGMDRADLLLCATPHSTSKIGDRHDLAHISSLGFRGEALYSIAQVAKLTVSSCTKGEIGYCLTAYQNEISEAIVQPMSVGTMVTVADLFANFPVRRNALPSMAQQLKTIQQIIYHLALCCPEITWQVTQNDQPWLQISEGKNASEILPQLLKSISKNDLIFREFQTREFDLADKTEFQESFFDLVLGLPDRCHRHQPDWIKLAINGRVVKFPVLENAIIKAFYRTLPRDRQPICFIHLHLPPEHIDWNRHPAKNEIYLQYQDLWQEIIQQAIARSLQFSEASLPKLENQRVLNLIQVAEKKGSYFVDQASNQGLEIVEKTPTVPLKVVGQARNTYILVEHPDGIWLVEQHIADERVRYEELQKNWQIVNGDRPIILSNLTPKQIEQLSEHLGLEVEPFGDNLWRVNTIPKALQHSEDLEATLVELSLGGDLGAAQAAIACRTAIKNGTMLDYTTMQNIINRWQQTQNPHTCPHGRPIYLSLEETSLYRFFRRHWVLGKSHGITEQPKSE